MEQEISPVIHPRDLLLLKRTAKLIIIDASSGADSKARYIATHLEGALYVDLETQLADIKANFSPGGRHPLPTPFQFSSVLTQLGITHDSHVIIYDDKNGSGAAARLWWMLKSIGHTLVQVVDGGFDGAVKAGFPLSSKEEIPLITKTYDPISWALPLSSIEDVERAVQNDNFLVIDVRAKERFNGEEEPIDPVAGHIPGAINMPFTDNLDEDGFFLQPEILKIKYLEATKNIPTENVTVHCGSGVTACHTLLAMDYAGLTIPGLYVGSWSEWCRSNRPVATIYNE